jgi:hypothetical protein
MIALASLEMREQRHVGREHRGPEFPGQPADGLGQQVIGGTRGLEP